MDLLGNKGMTRTISPQPKRPQRIEVAEIVTIEMVRAAKPKTIWWGAGSCWWTHIAIHLRTDNHGIPLSADGCPLFMADDFEGFLKAAEDNPGNYGKHGLRAFMAAHHSNCVRSLGDPMPWAGRDWQDYNDAIDRLDAREY